MRLNKAQKQALTEVTQILRGIRGDFGTTTQLGFDRKIDEIEADFAIKVLVKAGLVPKESVKA